MPNTSETAEAGRAIAHAIAFGAELAAVRAGVGTWGKALRSLKALSGARIVSLVQAEGTGRGIAIQSTAQGLEQMLALRVDLEGMRARDLSSKGRRRATPVAREDCWRMVIPLEVTEATVTSLVLHLDAEDPLGDLHAVAEQVATLWSGPATLTPRAAAAARPASSPLGPDNPLGLTRAEFRVCELLQTGKRPAKVAEALEVSIATVRSHLRNIYSKTDCDGIVELLHLLGGTEARDAA